MDAEKLLALNTGEKLSKAELILPWVAIVLVLSVFIGVGVILHNSEMSRREEVEKCVTTCLPYQHRTENYVCECMNEKGHWIPQ